MSTFRIEQDAAGHFRFILGGRSGRLLMDSGMHGSMTTCRRAIEAVRANAPFDWNYLRRETREGAFFILKTTSGERLGMSRVFFTRAERDKVIARLKRNAGPARVATNDAGRSILRVLAATIRDMVAGRGHERRHAHSLIRG